MAMRLTWLSGKRARSRRSRPSGLRAGLEHQDAHAVLTPVSQLARAPGGLGLTRLQARGADTWGLAVGSARRGSQRRAP